MRIVGCLTTLPSRIERLMNTLESLQSQSKALDAIYLNIPYVSRKEDTIYNVPEYLEQYCSVIRGQDYGPISGLIGALLQEDDPDTLIITFADNRIYNQDLVAKLVSKQLQNPNSAIGGSGFKIGGFPFYYSSSVQASKARWYNFVTNPAGEEVDVLCNSAGVIYRRDFFPELGKLLAVGNNRDSLYVDGDFAISGILSENGTKRIVHKMPGLVSGAVHWKLWGRVLAYYHATQEGFFKERAVYKVAETLTYPIIAVAVSVLVLFFLLSQGKN